MLGGTGAPDRKIVEPNRFASERADERPMRVAIVRGHARRQWLRSRPDDCVNACRRSRDRIKLQRGYDATASSFLGGVAEKRVFHAERTDGT
jgi:hypothetical protein